MKICIYGTGGVGGYFGGKLANYIVNSPDFQADIYFIARGDHLKKIQTNGLLLKYEDLDGFRTIVAKPTMATADVNSLPDIDIFFICVKSYDLMNVIDSISPKITDKTIILPLLNGVDIYQRIRNFIKKGYVFPACVYVGTHIESPGVIFQKGGEGKILLGPDPQSPGISPDKLLKLFNLAGIKYEWQIDPYPAIWSKFMFISGYGLVGAAEMKSLGEVYENPELNHSVTSVMAEIYQIASKKGILLPENVIKTSVNKAADFPYEIKTSFHRDVELKGKKNESDIFGLSLIELGKELGVDTPVTNKFYKKIMEK